MKKKIFFFDKTVKSSLVSSRNCWCGCAAFFGLISRRGCVANDFAHGVYELKVFLIAKSGYVYFFAVKIVVLISVDLVLSLGKMEIITQG